MSEKFFVVVVCILLGVEIWIERCHLRHHLEHAIQLSTETRKKREKESKKKEARTRRKSSETKRKEAKTPVEKERKKEED